MYFSNGKIWEIGNNEGKKGELLWKGWIWENCMGGRIGRVLEIALKNLYFILSVNGGFWGVLIEGLTFLELCFKRIFLDILKRLDYRWVMEIVRIVRKLL